MTRAAELNRDVVAVRRFNRFYTREVGVLRKTFLGTPWSLGEMRVLFEIAHNDATATDIAHMLDLDIAYLSRLLSRLEKQKLITRKSSIKDRRRYHLGLTASGLAAFNLANERQRAQTEATLRCLSVTERKQLTAAMATIEKLLHAKSNQLR